MDCHVALRAPRNDAGFIIAAKPRHCVEIPSLRRSPVIARRSRSNPLLLLYICHGSCSIGKVENCYIGKAGRDLIYRGNIRSIPLQPAIVCI